MASMSTHIPNSSDPSSSKTPNHKYDVFLSFRGADVRSNFLEYLYRALLGKGILTFKDEPKLEDGERINDGLLKAIEESKFAIVVLSKNYADSSWCLRELVHILKCKRDKGLLVYPIFYDVSPSDVRKQKGAFGEGFAKATKMSFLLCSFLSKFCLGINEEEINTWRNALDEVGNLKGWDYANAKFETEASLIDNLVHTIFCKSIGTYRVPDEGLVGIKYRMEQVIELLNLGLDETRVVGLWGMGGIGKTTLARAVYCSISWQFEGCCFIDNVREVFNRSGVLALQEKLISDILGEEDFKAPSIIDATIIIQKNVCRKKVLIVFDDVSEPNQVEDLVNELHRFGRGCRIIITTRYKQVLTVCSTQDIFNVQGLNTQEAIQLFKSKAFAENEETKEFQRLIYDAVDYAKGVPLALKVLGSFLLGGTVSEWECALDRLMEIPDDEVQRVLRISFDGLQWTEKEIFLDVACFFTGQKKYGICKDRVINILDSCGFNPLIGISVLVKKSLLTISVDNYLQMHDLVQQMGRSIVVEESRKVPGERSRLWRHEDIKRVLVENTGTYKVEGISYRDNEKIQLRPDAFAKMIDLRFLEVRATCCSIDLPNKLRCLFWYEYPLRSMPSTFQPEHLVELHLINSRIEQLWDTTMELPQLTGMNLSDSKSLINSPEFTSCPNLKYLDLENCRGLVNLHRSIGKLKNLQRLNLKGCSSLQTLPDGIILGLCQLQELYMGNIPIDWERGENKQGRNASLGEFKSLSNLHTLHIQIKDPIALTGSLLFRNLKKYQIQIGDGYVDFGSYDKCCSIHLSMPVSLEGNIKFLMKNSEELRLRGEFTKDLVQGFVEDGSRSLKCLVSDIDSLEYLANAEASLLLPSVELLHLANLGNLKQLSRSPLIGGSFENLKDLYVISCYKLKNLFQLPVTTGFVHLNKLVIEYCKSMEEVIWKEHRENETNKLVFLKLENLEINFLPSLVNFCRGIDEVEFPQLTRMFLRGLPKVQCLVSGFTDQSFFPHKVSFPSLKVIWLYNMENMKEIWCGQLQSGSFCNLTTLYVAGCHKLRAVFTPSQARYLLHLETLTIDRCSLLGVVVAKQEEEDGVGDTTLLPKLAIVKLSILPSLECFCHVAHDLEYPMLCDLLVIECPQLKTFSPGFVRTPKLNNVGWAKWKDNLNSTIAHLHKQYQFGSLSLQSMDTLENLANEEASSLLFTTLKTLSLENMDNLQQLSHSALVVIVRRFKNLTDLCVSKCNQLKNLFLVSVATEFMQLEKIVIKDCKSMEVVIHHEDETNKLAFPKLKELEIWDLPSLVSFCRGMDEVDFHQLQRIFLRKLPKVECLFPGLSNPSLFPHKVSFPCMKEISLYDMENMKEIWCGQLQSGSFCFLTTLYVTGCHKLRAVFTPSVAKYLVHLNNFYIKECSMLEAVIAKEEEEDGLKDTTLLPELAIVELNELPALESFCNVAHDLEYPMLRVLWVIECPQLKTFSPGFVRTPKLDNVMLTNWFPIKDVTIWKANLNSTISYLHKQYQFGSQSLRCLEVSNIDTLENLANASSSYLLFTTLESLSLKNLDNLQQLSHSPLMVMVGRFKNLTDLCVSGCNKLKNLFQLSVATEFMHLKKIVIKDCKSMKEVIGKEHKEDETNKLVFPKLERLEIDDLPSLVSFSRGIDEIEFSLLEGAILSGLPQVESLFSGQVERVFSGLSNQSFFPHKVSFPSLKYITLKGIVNMKEIWCGQLQSGSFCNLTYLEVIRCHKLRAVFTPSQARYLLHLQTLYIEYCSLLEIVVAKEEEEDGVEDTTLLPELKTVELNELPTLESFCHVAHDLEYPKLSIIRVIKCPELKTFSLGFVRTPELKNVMLTEWNAEKQVTLWEDNLSSTIERLHKQYQFGSRSLQRIKVSDMDTLENLANAEASSLLFTTLETLSLENMDNLQPLSHCPLVVIVRRFKNLTDLCVSKCHQLKNLFQLSVASEFMHLKKIVIKDCKNMEEVFWKEHREDETNKLVFPKLEELEIDDLPSVVSFCRGIDEVEFPELERMSLVGLPQVECLSSGMSNQSFFPHKVSFPSLYLISLKDMVNVKEIWCGQLQSNLTHLRVEGCDKLHAVFTPSAARYLVHLQDLFIKDCSLLEIVVAKEEEEDGVEDTTLLPKLKTVELNELPSLESFCHVAHDLEFPKLSIIRVRKCPELKTFSPGFVRTPKLKNEMLTERNADNLNSIIERLHKQIQEEQRQHEDGIEEENIEG